MVVGLPRNKSKIPVSWSLTGFFCFTLLFVLPETIYLCTPVPTVMEIEVMSDEETKKRWKTIYSLDDIPASWELGPDEECCRLELSMDEFKKKDPYVEIYARWREFMLPLSVEERRFVKKLVCGSDQTSKEEVDAWVKATKGQLDKKTK